MIQLPKNPTKKDYLQACKEHWIWAKENPDKEKSGCPYIPSDLTDTCFCCQERVDDGDIIGELDCSLCLLTGYAWKSNEWPACTLDRGSYFYQYGEADDKYTNHIIDREDFYGSEEELEEAQEQVRFWLKQKEYWANKMVEACDRALADL